MDRYEREATYSGKTQDALIAVKSLARQMVESDLTEADLYLPFDGGGVTIRIKRRAK